MKKVLFLLIFIVFNSCQTAEDYVDQGDSKIMLQKHDEAIDHYTKAIDLKPDFAEAYYLRGYSKSMIEDLNGAIDDYSKAIELKPDCAFVAIPLALVMLYLMLFLQG